MAEVICFDIDGVLTVEDTTYHQDLAGTYVYRSPRDKAKKVMVKAYDRGWYVLLFTGRREAQRRITEDWLHSHGFHYHALVMGKPYFTKIIDDRVYGVTVDNQLDTFEKELDEKDSSKATEETR